MGTERHVFSRLVVVKPYRKSGNGAKGGGRKGNSGKLGTIYSLAEGGVRTELASADGTTFADLSRKLRATGFIPQHVSLNKSGETHF